ncbi:MAG: hypothetical protein RJA44_954 [Pseudomonadota bacterium]
MPESSPTAATVAQAMRAALCRGTPEQSLHSALPQLDQHEQDTLVVLDTDERPLGLLTLRDLLRLQLRQPDAATRPLREVMQPARCIAADLTLAAAAEQLRQQPAPQHPLVVVDAAGRLRGLLDNATLQQQLAAQEHAAAAREHAQLRTLLDSLPDMVWLKDPDGRYLDCNPRTERFFGRPAAEIVGRSDAELLDPALAAQFRAHDLRAVAADAIITSNEELVFASDGHIEQAQTLKTPLRDAEGRLLGVLGIGRDVSALRQAEYQYRHMFERNPAPMLIYDRNNLALVSVNDAFTELYGYTRAQIGTLQLPDLYLPEDRADLIRRIPTLSGLRYAGEWRHQRHDGSLLHVMAHSHDIRYDGRDCRFMVIADISPQHRAAQRDRSRLALLENLSRGTGLNELLEQLVLDHELLFPRSLCSILLLDEAAGRLRLGAAPHLPEDYNQAIDLLQIGPTAGSCGAAAATGQRVLANDLNTHPNWTPYRALAQRAGLGACWSEPILGPQGRVLGTFAVYRPEPTEPSIEELAHLSFSAQLAATAISHWHTAEQLRRSEQRLREIVHHLPGLVWLQDAGQRLQACNAAFEQRCGRPLEQLIGRPITELLDAESAAALTAGEARIQATGRTWRSEQWLALDHAATQGLFELIRTPLLDADGQLTGVLGVALDVTQRKRQEEHIQRLNQTYAMLSEVNEAIVRLRDPEALYAEICRIAVAVGGFRLAWAGRLDASSGLIVPIAHAGHSDGYVEQLQLQAGSDGPTARAMRSGRPWISGDITRDPLMRPWRDQAIRHRYQASACFPIVVAGQPRSCLNIYSEHTGHFDAELVALFTRLTANLGFALEFHATEAAQRHEQQLREQLMEAVAGVVFAIDPAGRIRLWNQRFADLSGDSTETILQRRISDYFEGDDQRLLLQRIGEGFSNGESSAEATLHSRDGRRTPCLFVSRRIDQQPEPLLVSTGLDISGRVRTEQELARYRQHLEELVAHRTAELEQANLRLQREDERLRSMLRLSQRASSLSEAELFQQGIDEITRLSRSASACLHSVDADIAVLRSWRQADGSPSVPDQTPLQQHVLAQRAALIVQRGDPVHGDLLAHCPAGIEHAIGVPVHTEDRICLVICASRAEPPYDEHDARELLLIGQDLWRILQRRRIELALQTAKSAADASNRAKSAFLANMSHEIRTPMNAITGFAHLLQRDPLTPRQLDHLNKITEAGQHLIEVINDILDYSKIEAQKIELDESDFELGACVDRIAAQLGPRLNGRPVQLRTRLAPELPPRLHGDRLRLEQILLNLLGNAIKFTRQGHVELRIGVVPSAGATPLLRFEVEDTGIGIAPDKVEHLFAAFEQGDVSTTRRFGGTGLGLALTKGLVELMDGRIGARSQAGQGSTFWFEIPLQPAEDLGPAAPAPIRPLPALSVTPLHPAAPLRPARILVAEDHPINQRVVSELLHALGQQVDVADNGEQAVQQARLHQHDLILMDLQMPGLDGLQATAAIRQIPGRQRVPIVAMSVETDAEARARCSAAGMNDLLLKPMEPEQLRQCLVRWLGRALPGQPAAPAPATAADSDVRLRQRIEALDGLQVAEALKRLRGNWSLYLRTLRLFISHHSGDPEQLDAISADAGALRHCAHSLAGAAATIGAETLAGQARALELQIAALPAASAVPADAVQRLREPLQQFLAELGSALDERPRDVVAAAAAPLDWHEVRHQLDNMRQLLRLHDTAVGDVLDTAKPLLLHALGERAGQLEQEIQSFSFDDALQTLDSLLGDLPAD